MSASAFKVKFSDGKRSEEEPAATKVAALRRAAVLAKMHRTIAVVYNGTEFVKSFDGSR